MIFVVKIRSVFSVIGAMVLAVAISLTAIFFAPQAVVAMQTSGEYTVVLDAGHGGVDAGVIGVTSKVAEREVNLQITKRVQRLLTKNNINVVLTREDERGLYGDDMENFKRKDFAARRAIIEKAAPDVMVSIHCNKFPTATRRGAQVFFHDLSDASRALAVGLQASLNMLNLEQTQKTYAALKGDYYMLRCTQYPSAIVECGFLSNPEDDRLLTDLSYQEKISYQIFSGIIGFLKTNATTETL